MECSLPDFAVHGNSPGKNTVVGCHFLLQGIFPNQGLNLGLLHCRNILYLSSLLSHFFFFFWIQKFQRFDSLGWLGETRTKWKKFAKSNILPAELKALHLQITIPCCHYNHLVSPPSPPKSYLYLAGLHTSKNSLKKKKEKILYRF